MLSSIWSALVGIVSALLFGALTGLLWGGFRARKQSEGARRSPALLLSFALGALIWAIAAAMLLSAILVGGVPLIQIESWWFGVLFVSIVPLGLPGWVLALVGWRKTRGGRSGFEWGVAGGVLMTLTGIMLLPGALAIVGGVLSRGTRVSDPGTAEIGR